MILDTTSKSIVISLDQSVTDQIDWTITYVDIDSDIAASLLTTECGTTNNTTEVTMLAAPSAEVSRKVMTIFIANPLSDAPVVRIGFKDGDEVHSLLQRQMTLYSSIYWSALTGWK